MERDVVPAHVKLGKMVWAGKSKRMQEIFTRICYKVFEIGKDFIS